MIRRTPRSTRTDTLVTYTTRFRSFGNRVFSDVIPFPSAGIDAPDFQYSRNTDSEAANRCPADECYDAQHVMLPPPKVISSSVPDSRACRDISPAPSEARPISRRRAVWGNSVSVRFDHGGG